MSPVRAEGPVGTCTPPVATAPALPASSGTWHAADQHPKTKELIQQPVHCAASTGAAASETNTEKPTSF